MVVLSLSSGGKMKRALIISLAVMLAGCTVTPDKYAASLPENDPKYNTKECRDIRKAALEFDNKTGQRMAVGLVGGALLGVFFLPFAAASDAEREEARKLFAREIHMRCSSKPLPKNLEVTSKSGADRAKRT
ncbi:hypothetical protein [Agrobacterium sp. ST15.13.015]|uniref:hypothetical protein n=1 Tax=Agrobacterium sp. ST15.13.015 TaxID=3017319 RepID=UPI0022C2102F|nr:hypothetical protein [Agrobacterium sp. ST15.13.015]MCZ7500693.1 hypothetical protein [Rhizobium rhizogenes]